MKHTKKQLEDLSGRNVLLVGLLSRVVRYEPFNSNDKSGEICVGGIRYYTNLDKKGFPLVSASIKEAMIRNILREQDKQIGHELECIGAGSNCGRSKMSEEYKTFLAQTEESTEKGKGYSPLSDEFMKEFTNKGKGL